jgi:hypothetical protein
MSDRPTDRVDTARTNYLRNPYGNCNKGADCLSDLLSLPSRVGPQWMEAGSRNQGVAEEGLRGEPGGGGGTVNRNPG